MVKHAINKQKH